MKLASLKESKRHKNSMIMKTEWKFDVLKIRNNTFYLNKIDNHLSVSQNVKVKISNKMITREKIENGKLNNWLILTS